MASAKFLEEALSTDVDESAVNAIVGSLETQLVTSAAPASQQTQQQHPVNNQNHHQNTQIANGATPQNTVSTAVASAGPQNAQLHKQTIANGDSITQTTTTATAAAACDAKQVTIISTAGYINQDHQGGNKTEQQQQQPPQAQQVKIVQQQPQPNQAMSSSGAILQNRVTLPNGTISLPQQKVVLKTTGGAPGAPAGLVTVPMNAVQQANNVGSPSTQQQTTNIISGLQVVNVRPGVHAAQQKGQPARVVLSAPQLVGARAGAPQLTLQSFHGLQPGQQGALLLKTENGQYQLLRVGPPPTAVSQAGQPVAFRMQTIPSTAVSASTTPIQTSTISSTTPAVQQGQVVQQAQVTQVQVQRPANDNTKEKCRKFLANLLELSSREPKAVEKNVRTLIQELIDNKVEPEDFCDKLERLLNASPQPCLIGFLKKSLPLLRHSLATQEMTIDGIRPPPPNVVFSIAGATPTVQTVRPGMPTNQVRIVAPGGTTTTAVVRPGQVIQQRLMAPVRAPGPPQQQTVTPVPATATRMQIARPQQTLQQNQQQPPALHPVYPNAGQQIRAGTAGIVSVRPPVQVRTVAPGVAVSGASAVTQQQQIRQQVQIRHVIPAPPTSVAAVQQQQQQKAAVAAAVAAATNRAFAPGPGGGGKMPVGGGAQPGKQQQKDKEKKTSQSSAAVAAAAAAAASAAAYGAGDDDINDVAAMGGVNLAEETQKILGSTEFVGTQIRSCKEEPMCSMSTLQQKIRQALQRHDLDEPATADVAACVSHAAQERLRNLIEKLAVITEHRLENVRQDARYEVTNDVKGQLKFLEELDKAERKRHEETERELLLRAAKSRSKCEDPEQAKLKAKAKEMQRVEMEELRQREANATALQAIGPRKRPRLDGVGGDGKGAQQGMGQSSTGMGGSSCTPRAQMPLRQRMKKVTMRDLQFLFETEKDLCKSKLLYRSYLK